MELVLSLFPGVDLFGRGFEAEGFCVVRGPDVIFGGDIRNFRAPSGRFNGVIGGPPCQDFSRARRTEPTGHGLEMIDEFVRVIDESRPDWFLMENVPCVPNVTVRGYTVQRIDLCASECGSDQRRLRHFQFGSPDGHVISPVRIRGQSQLVPPCLASDGRKSGRASWSEFCRLQGLDDELDLPSFTVVARYQAVGNGVPVQMARVMARAVRSRLPGLWAGALCRCGCGRQLAGREKCASPGCRKRLERHRKCDPAGGVTDQGEGIVSVTGPRAVTELVRKSKIPTQQQVMVGV